MSVKLHSALEFRNEMDINLSQDKTILKKSLGNVNTETDLTFEYQLKSVRKLLELSIDPSVLSHIPFQLQLMFTALDGSRHLRVFT
jgi:hypothetical protein